MWTEIASRIPLTQIEEHFEKWPVSETIILSPKKISGSQKLLVPDQKKHVWIIHEKIYTSIEQLDLKRLGAKCSSKTIFRIQNAVNEYVRRNQLKMRDDVKSYFSCTNHMGPFLNMKSKLIFCNGSKFMKAGNLTVDSDNIVWESLMDQVIAPHEQEQKLEQIGEIQLG